MAHRSRKRSNHAHKAIDDEPVNELVMELLSVSASCAETTVMPCYRASRGPRQPRFSTHSPTTKQATRGARHTPRQVSEGPDQAEMYTR